jgi:hypothetical protein
MIAAQPVGCSTTPHHARIDTLAAQQVERDIGKGIRTDRAGEQDRGAGTARGQGLIGTLSPGEQRVVASQDCLARLRQPRNRDDQIGVDRPKPRSSRLLDKYLFVNYN